MHYSHLWTPLAYLLCLSTQATGVLADYNSDYKRLCPGNNPVTIGTTLYTVTCDKTMGGSAPVQKLGYKQNPTPEECAQECEKDRGTCTAMIWANKACFQSSDKGSSMLNAPGVVVLTPPPLPAGKTPEQLQKELGDCEAERDGYKVNLAADPNSHLDPSNYYCNENNDDKIITFGSTKYVIKSNQIMDQWQGETLYKNYDYRGSLRDCLSVCGSYDCGTMRFNIAEDKLWCVVAGGSKGLKYFAGVCVVLRV
ncbi:hypothetical protein BDV25DRAFT_138506 [Aspergillus avenaceus]|uniref:Apple domain-containing protein n=1 Tax=Aspergillus avenaceus TaxID=36643 RepID=A0A5N6TZK3_ASPAV|nr:hypothetical protein BDV25DRAFT_138506 [Aspergillus avenaceus]